MPAKPILDGVELQQVERIEGDQEQILRQHRIPALEGDFFQKLGRRAIRVKLKGVLTGKDAGKSLEGLRTKFRTAKPVPFVADIATATKVIRVLIQEMDVRELAGKPERFEYAVTLVEFIGPASGKASPPASSPQAPPPPALTKGKLAIEVTLDSQPRFAAGGVTLNVAGAALETGQRFSQTLTQRSVHTWHEEEFPPGRYTVNAVGSDPPMSGTAEVVVEAGQTSRVTVRLGAGIPVARTFIVHFPRGKAFIEPSQLPVLRQVADYARSHPHEKLAILGHTDLVGAADYNQLLSERRALAVFGYLTHGRRFGGSTFDWNTIRKSDSWSRKEYESILRQLRYFQGQIEKDHTLANAAVREFQQDNYLHMDGVVGEDTWSELIQKYLDEEALTLAEDQILSFEAGGPRWLGRGGQDPVRNTADAWRPNRRTELIFVRPDDVARIGEWLIQPAEPGSFIVRGSIRMDDGKPLANTKYVLTAPDGECMDGERPSGTGRGQPIPGSTNGDGTFAYADNPKGIGIYSLEIQGPFLACLNGEKYGFDRSSPSVWKRLDGRSEFGVTVTRRPAAC